MECLPKKRVLPIRASPTIILISNIMLMMLFMMLLSTTSAQAATLTGSLYDLALQKESDAIVEIDTVPKQLLVSKDGDYSFNVKPGNYTLHAYTSMSEASEQISVLDDGEYILDLILEDTPLEWPDISLIDTGIQVSTSDPSDGRATTYAWLVIGGIMLIFIAIAYILMRSLVSNKKLKHKEKIVSNKILSIESGPVDEHEQKILNLIKKEKRTTQKDIRKEVPLSEAKISLILTDLEDKGKIRKIKKGRGNILIFVKD